MSSIKFVYDYHTGEISNQKKQTRLCIILRDFGKKAYEIRDLIHRMANKQIRASRKGNT